MTTTNRLTVLCDRLFNSVQTFNDAINELATRLQMDANDPTLFRVASIVAGRELPEAFISARTSTTTTTETTPATTEARRASRRSSRKTTITKLSGRSLLLTPRGARVDLTKVVHNVLRANAGRTMRPSDIVKTLRKSGYKYNGRDFSRSIADSLRRNPAEDIQRVAEGYFARS